MSFEVKEHQPPYPGELREAVFKEAVGHDRAWMKDYWVRVLDPDYAYEEPSNRSLDRWMQGERLPKGAKERVLKERLPVPSTIERNLFGPLSDRYWVQRVVTDLMNKAEAEGFRMNASAGYEERHKKWDDELTKLYKAYMDNVSDWDWDIDAVEIGSFLIFGAKYVESFPTKILQLFEKHDYRNIRDCHPQFLPELKEMLGLTNSGV